MRCAKISCKPSGTEAKWKGNILLLMQRCTAAIYVLAFGNNSNLIILGIIKKTTFPLYCVLSANEVYEKWETDWGWREGADSLMVNCLCSFHRINGVRIDSDSLLTYGISQSENPFGTTGTTKLDMDLDICITLRFVKTSPLIALEWSQRRHDWRCSMTQL